MGIPLPSGGWVCGGGYAPSAENFRDFCLKWHMQDFFCSSKGGDGPITNTPLVVVVVVLSVSAERRPPKLADFIDRVPCR